MSDEVDGSDGAASPMLSIQRVKPAYEQVAAQLRDLIINGSIAPGDRLPVESELPALFGVSRSTIREALRVLSSQNLVETRRGVHGGTYVVKPQAEYVGDYLEASLGLMAVDDSMTIDDLIEVRELLEIRAARLAAARRDDRHVHWLKTILDEQGPGVPTAFSENRDFHRVILDAANNPVLEMVTRPMFGVLQTRIQRSGASSAFWSEVYRDHERITRAVEARDEEQAGTAMLQHLEHLRGHYRRLERKLDGKASRSKSDGNAARSRGDGKRTSSR